MVNDKDMRPPATEKVQAQGPNKLVGTSEEVPSTVKGVTCNISSSLHTLVPGRSQGDCSKNARGKHKRLARPTARKVPAFCLAPQPEAMRETKEESRLTRKVSCDTYRATDLYRSSVRIL